jgi:hypothetical protein
MRDQGRASLLKYKAEPRVPIPLTEERLLARDILGDRSLNFRATLQRVLR